MDNKFVGLIILDGFGISKQKQGNAIDPAPPLNFNYYFEKDLPTHYSKQIPISLNHIVLTDSFRETNFFLHFSKSFCRIIIRFISVFFDNTVNICFIFRKFIKTCVNRC